MEGMGKTDGTLSGEEKARPGYDFVHSAVDDHSRVAYSEILGDETADTSAGFMLRAAAWFAEQGIEQINEVMTDNHWLYTKSGAFTEVLEVIGADHVTIRPHCPWQNGKVERFNRTLQIEWAYRQVFTSNEQRSEALPGWLNDYKLPAQPQLPRRTPAEALDQLLQSAQQGGAATTG